MHLEIHVRPSASRTTVGGSHDGALVVRVTQAADQGKATAAAMDAVADALGISHRSVALVRGTRSRRKLIDVDTTGTERGSVEARVAALLERDAR